MSNLSTRRYAVNRLKAAERLVWAVAVLAVEPTDQLYARGPLEEEDARLLAREARKTAGLCGCCGQKLSPGKPAYWV